MRSSTLNLLFFAGLLCPGIALGQGLNIEDKNQVRVEEAFVDESTNQLTVIGHGLGTAGLRLGDPLGPTLPIISRNATSMTVQLPAGLIPGNYMVSVRYRPKKNQVFNTYFEITLGAEGPPGPAGPPGPTGPGSRSIIGGGSNSLPTSAGTTYMGPFSNFLVQNTSDARRPLPGTGTISKLRVRLETPPNGTGADEWLFTVRKDGTDTSLGCSVFETFGKCNDLVDCVDWSAGQAIDVSVITSGSPLQSSAVYWTAEYRQGESCP